jgi:ABC-type multidrug transport system fused ATPase/permease subunit
MPATIGHLQTRIQFPQGEYIAKYTNEADTIKARHFQMLPLFWEILFKIILVSAALFILDWRIALITIGLLTTPLYVPKLIEKRLQKAQKEYLKAVEENLAKVKEVIAKNGASLSGGEKKRICFARALLRDTNVLILDEPLANLDDTTACKIDDLLLSIKGKTMIIVSHHFPRKNECCLMLLSQ